MLTERRIREIVREEIAAHATERSCVSEIVAIVSRGVDRKTPWIVGFSEIPGEPSEDMKKIMRENSRALDLITKKSPGSDLPEHTPS